MLEYRKRQFAEQFANYTLKINPYLIRLSGYNPQETLLKIDEYTLHCIPATLSTDCCNLILSLDEKEIGFFNRFKNTIISLYLNFDPSYFDKSTSFFLKGTFEELKLVRKGVYTLMLNFKTTSNTYKELFFYLSDLVTTHKIFYKNDPVKQNNVLMTPVPFSSVAVYHNKELIAEDKITKLSSSILKVSKNGQLVNLSKENTYALAVKFNERTLQLTGSYIEDDDNSSVFKLNYNTEYNHALSRIMKARKIEYSENSVEELEELN